jgi:hypothetical protein
MTLTVASWSTIVLYALITMLTKSSVSGSCL